MGKLKGVVKRELYSVAFTVARHLCFKDGNTLSRSSVGLYIIAGRVCVCLPWA